MNRTVRTWWRPTTGFFLVFWVGLMWAGRSKMLRDPGTLWHTVVGQRILERGELPRTDPFSFTQAGQSWIAQQWLGECAMAVIHRVSGLDGLMLATVTLLSGVFAFLGGRLLRSGLPWPAAAMLLVLVFGASSYHFFPRPHLVTILLLTFTVALLSDVEAGRARARRLLWLPPIMVLWTNVHGGALGGLATLFLVLMSWLLRPRDLRRVRNDPRATASPVLIATALGLSCLAVLVNPYGPALPRVWISLMNSKLLPRLILEHAPPNPLTVEGGMLLALAVVYLVTLAAAWRRGVRVVWLVPLVWLVMAWSRIRHGPLFAVTAAVAIADMLPHTRLPAWFARRAGPRVPIASSSGGPGWRAAAIPVLLVLVAAGLQASGIRCPIIGANWCRLDPAYWPIEATAALRREINQHPAELRVFNDMRFGGYLIYRADRTRVYIDDRCELYREPGLRRYVDLRRHPALVEGAAAYDDIALALVQTRSPVARYLDGSPTWTRLHRDATASVYRRITQD